jgi:hypothetical protein
MDADSPTYENPRADLDADFYFDTAVHCAADRCDADVYHDDGGHIAVGATYADAAD